MHKSQSLSDNFSTCFGRHYHPSSGAQNMSLVWNTLHVLLLAVVLYANVFFRFWLVFPLHF